MPKGRKTRGAKTITARQRSARRKNIAVARAAKKGKVKPSRIQGIHKAADIKAARKAKAAANTPARKARRARIKAKGQKAYEKAFAAGKLKKVRTRSQFQESLRRMI
jgi:hypothetical protein